ncbi:nitrogen metabolic regulation nmr [Fusarium sp. NRRL 52700]|nr:nitrogen metabolic regulation nmr [Fusarium sp. NRRL 52700]
MTTQVPALTTTFTPAKSCFQYYKYRYTGDELTCLEGGTGAPSACTYMQLGPSGSDANCFPSSLELGSTFYYSPGICPSGYEVACSSTVGGETRATCCPSSFSCQTEKGWPWYSTDLCTIAIPRTVEVIVSESVVGGDWKRTTVSGAAANAIGIPIRWHSSDFASTTTGARTSATGSATETLSSSTGTSSSDSSSDSGGLSIGAKAGIGAGIGVVALVGFAALAWFVLRARRAKQANIAATTRGEEAKEPQMQPQLYPWELDSHETMVPAELPSDSYQKQSTKAMSKTIVIVGVTGAQGGSVAQTFLQLPSWHVRGITRNPGGDSAKRLKSEGVEIVQGDLDDKESLIRAFQGAHAIFSNTDFFTHLQQAMAQPDITKNRTTLEYAYDREVGQGINIAEAAADPSVIKTLERFVMSTLSHATKWSGGKYTNVYHFDSKAAMIKATEERFPEVAVRMSTVTIGHYVTVWKLFDRLAPKLQPDGSYLMSRNTPRDFKMPFIVTERDTGGFVKAMVDLPSNKHILGVSEEMTLPEWVEIWGRVNGVKAVYKEISRDELFEGVPEDFAKEIGDGFDYFHEFGLTGGDPAVLHADQLGVRVPVTSMEEYIRSEDWSTVIQ